MKSAKEISLENALRSAGLETIGLPPKYRKDKDPFWIMALVLVRKTSMEECYCIYRHRADGYMQLIEDCGGVGVIMPGNPISIHPYIYFDERRFSPFSDPKDMRAFLLRANTDDKERTERINNASDEELSVIMLEYGIEQQLKNRDIDREQNAEIENNEEEREAHRKEVEEAAFEAEIASMYRDGVRRSEIERLKDEFAHRNDQQGKNDAVVENIPLDEEVRLENENKDEMDEGKKEEHPASVEGEFDAVEITDEEIAEAKARNIENRRKTIRGSVRRIRSAATINESDVVAIDENGEPEKIENIFTASELGTSMQKKGKSTKTSRRKTTRKKKEKCAVAKRPVGRPRKNAE